MNATISHALPCLLLLLLADRQGVLRAAAIGDDLRKAAPRVRGSSIDDKGLGCDNSL